MLTDVEIRKAKPREKPYKLTDSAGLHLYVSPAGGRLWRYRYEFGGGEKLLSLGPYPALSLAGAREARDSARKMVRAGRDPAVAKKVAKAAIVEATGTTFESVAREWFKLNEKTWVRRHADDVMTSLERDVFPSLGALPLSEITPPVVLTVLRRIEARPAIETARRVRQRISAVFAFAMSSGRAVTDPAAIVRGAMAPLRKGRQPAVTKLDDLRAMLRKVEAEAAHPITRLAHRLLALTVVRPGALIETPWTELADLAVEPVWQVPAARMKLRLAQKDDEARDHLVPLPAQAMDVIAVVRTMTGEGPIVFPNARFAHRPMSENAIGYLLNRAGYHGHHVPHGWRAAFSTVMNERFPNDRAVIDLMLAHVPSNKVEGAYNRAAHLARRRELAQAWADMLLEGMPPASALLCGPRR